MNCQYQRNKSREDGNRTNGRNVVYVTYSCLMGTGHCDLDMMKQAQINVILFLYCLWINLQCRKWCSRCSIMW